MTIGGIRHTYAGDAEHGFGGVTKTTASPKIPKAMIPKPKVAPKVSVKSAKPLSSAKVQKPQVATPASRAKAKAPKPHKGNRPHGPGHRGHRGHVGGGGRGGILKTLVKGTMAAAGVTPVEESFQQQLRGHKR